MNRKGTEKPIEIFVALFIILAVALVMLKLFQSQIADKQKELSDVQQESKAKEMQDKVRLACAEKCTQASNQGCSQAALASLCMFGSHNVYPNGYIDLNNNKVKDNDNSLLAGINVCEDSVYCFHVLDSCCAQRIDAKSCKDILQTYWGATMPPGEDLDALLTSSVSYGSCTDPGSARWDVLASWP